MTRWRSNWGGLPIVHPAVYVYERSIAMSRPMDHLAEQIRLYQHGQLSRRQLLQRGAALGLSATGLAALGAINPVAGQERFVRPSIRAVTQEGETLKVALATAQKTGDLGPVDAMV